MSQKFFLISKMSSFGIRERVLDSKLQKNNHESLKIDKISLNMGGKFFFK